MRRCRQPRRCWASTACRCLRSGWSAASPASVSARDDALSLLPRFVPATGPTGAPIVYGLTAAAVGQGVLIGVLVAVLFALVPLLRVRRVRPSLLLRQESDRRRASTGCGWRPRRSWASRSWAWRRGRPVRCGSGSIVCGGFVAITLVLLGGRLGAGAADAAAAEVRRLRRCATRRSISIGPAIRRGSCCSPSASAASSSSAFARCRPTCSASSRSILSDQAPDMFLIDIQQDQAGPARSVSVAAHCAGAAAAPAAGAARARDRACAGARCRSNGWRMFAAAVRWRANTRSPIGLRSRPTSGSSPGASGRRRRRRHRKCRSRKACATGSASRLATRSASTFSASRSRRASPACAR